MTVKKVLPSAEMKRHYDRGYRAGVAAAIAAVGELKNTLLGWHVPTGAHRDVDEPDVPARRCRVCGSAEHDECGDGSHPYIADEQARGKS
jgi:hypothetical protein